MLLFTELAASGCYKLKIERRLYFLEKYSAGGLILLLYPQTEGKISYGKLSAEESCGLLKAKDTAKVFFGITALFVKSSVKRSVNGNKTTYRKRVRLL
jgi:hypothetical protein